MNNKDESQTNLINENQVYKDDIRIEAIGSVDESTAALGFAKACSDDALIKQRISTIQTDLYLLMAALAGQDPQKDSQLNFEESRVEWLEDQSAIIKKDVSLPKRFILPGESIPSAAMALARTTVRRAERRVVSMQKSDYGVNPVIINYLNRLSYVCYLMELVEIQKISNEQ